jgi:cholesterol oxidase
MGHMTGHRFDAIVVGSGFGGAVNAARLAEAGLRVLVLERGPWWGPGQATRPDGEWRLYPRGLLGSRKLFRGIRWARNGRRVERVVNLDGFLEIHQFDRLLTVTSSGVGGGSHHYTSTMEEPPAEFFDAYPPEITGPELHPYFERVRAMLRPSPVPQRPEKDEVFDKAVAQAGLPTAERPDLAVAWGDDPQHPRTVTNAAGVSQCTSTYRSWAFVGSEDGSNTTLDVTPLALAHGAELRPFCEVIGIGAIDGGYEVHYVDHRTAGEQHTGHAPRLILAAGCLNTLRPLFAARDRDRSLTGLSKMLGRRFSGNGDRLSLVWRSRILQDSSWGPPISAVSNVSRDGRHRFAVGAIGLPVHAMPVPPALASRLRTSAFVFTMGRDAPTGPWVSTEEVSSPRPTDPSIRTCTTRWRMPQRASRTAMPPGASCPAVGPVGRGSSPYIRWAGAPWLGRPTKASSITGVRCSATPGSTSRTDRCTCARPEWRQA